MIEIDGAHELGSGTIVRMSIALASMFGEELHLTGARGGRSQPGLRPQHLTSVRACAELCAAETQGLAVGATEFTYAPSGRVRSGHFEWDIGTAGSTTMLALAVLPIMCLAPGEVTARITGGVFQDYAPCPYQLQHVLGPLLRRAGVEVEIDVVRPGYVPQGAGVLALRVSKLRGRALEPLQLLAPGDVASVEGVALASHLRERDVSDRMATACEQRLVDAGLDCRIERIEDTAAAHAGAALSVWAHSSTGGAFGSGRVGARRRASETIGEYVADNLLTELASGATTDRHVADQLVFFAPLARGTTRYITPHETRHLRSNLWVARQFGLEARCVDRTVEIEGAR